MPVRPLNATAASLLGFLHEGPMTGWDLVAVAQQRIGGFWTLTQSQVYRELAAMAKTGLVEVGPPGPRDRKPYTITTAGRAAFAKWIDREPGPEQIRFPLLLTMVFARHLPPHRLAEMLAAHRAVHAERLASYEEQEAAIRDQPEADPVRATTLDFGLRYERAVLDWFDQLPATLAALAVAGDLQGRHLGAERSKCTLLLAPEPAADFDELATRLRSACGRKVDKSEIIRAWIGLTTDDPALLNDLAQEIQTRHDGTTA